MASHIAKQFGQESQVRAKELGLSYDGQVAQETHKDSHKRYLNVTGSGQSTPIEGTEVEGVPHVQLQPLDWQLFWSNVWHQQPKPPAHGVRRRRSIFMSFTVEGGVAGLPQFKKRPRRSTHT